MSDLAERISRLPKEQRSMLLRHLRGAADGPPAAEGLELAPRERGDEAVASFAQEQLWLVDRLGEGRWRNNVALTVRLRGPLDVGTLRRALDEIVARHEVLRTTFRDRDGVPRQAIGPAREVELPLVDLTDLAPDEREARALEIGREEEARRFDLERGPLMRALLLRHGPQDHQLLWVVHHVAWDSGSYPVFLGELRALYEAFSRGEPSPLPDLPVQYADFAAWQRETVEGDRGGALRDYWRRQLGGAETTELPSDRPRRKDSEYHGERVFRRLEGEVLEQLKAIGNREGATLFMTLLGALDVLLAVYAGRDDVVVGTASAVRRREELKPLIGCFVNMLVLRTDLAGDPTFAELVRRVRTTVLDAFAHHELPFEQVVEVVNPPRDPTRNPLFQIEFTVFVGDEAPTLRAGELDLEVDRVPISAARFDMSVLAWEADGGLGLSIEYNTDLYERATIERLVDAYARVIQAVAAAPDRPVSEISLVGDEELALVAEEWARGPAAAGAPTTVDRAFAAQAAATPEALAVVAADASLTYRELDRRANRIAHRLRSLGVGADALVGVCLARSADAVAALLGIAKAGGAYVPLDPSYPPARLAAIVADAGARVVVASEATRGSVEGAAAQVLSLDGDADEAPEDPLEPVADPSSLAYVLYTSGSTGTPKGVMVAHGSVTAFVEAIRDAYEIGPEDAIVQFASLSFDVSVFEVYAALLTGARVVVATDAERAEPELLTALMRERGVTVAELPPTVLPLLDPAELPRLRLVSVGGEPTPAGVVDAWARGRRMVNGYGPTETTVAVTLMDCEPGLDRPPPIGRPTAGHQALVLDGWLAPVPVGVPGELCIAGPGLARGYLGRPDLTAEAFVPNPFPREPGERLYRTGDLARWLADGTLEFLGRRDRQVKIRGFRVELGDVEAALTAHPAVRRAVVEPFEDERGRRLVAYLEPANGPVPDVTTLRDFVGARLPDYMVPAWIVELPEIPLTSAGKVDRRALPAPDDGRPDLGQEALAPRNAVEQRILDEIFGPVLGVDGAGVDDNFFGLGGNSLQATQVVSRVRSGFGVEIRLADFYEAPTVARLAELVAAAGDGRDAAEARLRESLDRIDELSDDEVHDFLALLGGSERR